MRCSGAFSRWFVLSAVIVLFWHTAALAVLPEDRLITYSIRENPQDAESDVVFEIALKLTAIDNDISSVGWLIENAEFTQLDEYGDPVAIWGFDYPEVDSPDGLWWVDHGVIADPQPDEFKAPPTLEGTATALDPSDPDLDFFVQTGTCTGSCTSMYGGLVTSLDHVFVAVGETEPIEEGDEEPTEIDDNGGPV